MHRRDVRHFEAGLNADRLRRAPLDTRPSRSMVAAGREGDPGGRHRRHPAARPCDGHRRRASRWAGCRSLRQVQNSAQATRSAVKVSYSSTTAWSPAGYSHGRADRHRPPSGMSRAASWSRSHTMLPWCGANYRKAGPTWAA